MTTTAPATHAVHPERNQPPRPKRHPKREAPSTATALTRELEDPVAPLRAIVRAVTRRVHERPLTAVAAMIGIGIVVGGGLSFRLGRLLLAAAGRHVVREVLKQVL